jgi:hypothetical protein
VGSTADGVDPGENVLGLVAGPAPEGEPPAEEDRPGLVVGSRPADEVTGDKGLELGAPELEGSAAANCCTAPVLNLPMPVALTPSLPSTV